MNEDIKICPYCGEQININAIKCKHCGESLIEQKNTQDSALKAKEIVQLLPKIKGLYSKITHIIKPVWIKVNLIFARLLAVLMIGGLIWERDYLDHNRGIAGNVELHHTLFGIFWICMDLTAVVIVLNVIATILAHKYIDNKTTSTKETNQEK